MFTIRKNSPDLDNPTLTLNVLGGKGYHLAQMCKLGINVPPAFVFPTTICSDVLCGAVSPVTLETMAMSGVEALRDELGYTPLLSVRSGARVSMPGMMNTILNVGLTNKNIAEWEKRIGAKAAWDSYRRLVQMFGDVVFGIDPKKYEEVLTKAREGCGVLVDSDLPLQVLREVTEEFLVLTPGFPQTLKVQLRKAIKAVFMSWNTDRAKTYRKLHGIPDDIGTACILQVMVFGNLNDQSATGVAFTRCPSTGNAKITGEFLVNAQGEDVVAGIRTPQPLQSLVNWNPEVSEELSEVLTTLEGHYKDMQDVEFTVQSGELFILQTRSAKRSVPAQFTVALDLFEAGTIDKETLLSRVSRASYSKLLATQIKSGFDTPPTAVGLPASSGVATGVAVFSSERAVSLASTKPVILVSKETTPDDIAGMAAAGGILTQTGGATSHAAVVARGMNKVCVVGCAALTQTSEGWEAAGVPIVEGVTTITIEGITGKVWVGVDVPVEGGSTELKDRFDRVVLADCPSYISYDSPESAHGPGLVDTRTVDHTPEALEKLPPAFSGVLLLSCGPVTSELDESLSCIYGDRPLPAATYEKVRALLKTPRPEGSKVSVVFPAGTTLSSVAKINLSKAGYSVGYETTTLQELVLASEPLVVLSPNFSETSSVVSRVVKMLGVDLGCPVELISPKAAYPKAIVPVRASDYIVSILA